MNVDNVADYAFDLHSGLATLRVPEFDQLPVLGMAATLAIHIKGLGEIEYDLLRLVSDHFLSIPSIALKPVLQMMEEIGFVRLIQSGKTIEKIIPTIPAFQGVYSEINSYAKSEVKFNEHEQATLSIIDALHNSPKNKDALFNTLGAERSVFKRAERQVLPRSWHVSVS